MSEAFLHLFDTPLGRCGIAWRGRQVIGASFPEKDDAGTLQRLRKQADDAKITDTVPAEIQAVINAILSLMEGKKTYLLEVDVSLDGVSDFERNVYALTRRIRPGETRTYGDLAKDLGDLTLSQPVGKALGRNPVPIIVPCHRVIGADGNMTGFSAPGGVETKRRLLKIEGAIEPDLFDLIG